MVVLATLFFVSCSKSDEQTAEPSGNNPIESGSPFIKGEVPQEVIDNIKAVFPGKRLAKIDDSKKYKYNGLFLTEVDDGNHYFLKWHANGIDITADFGEDNAVTRWSCQALFNKYGKVGSIREEYESTLPGNESLIQTYDNFIFSYGRIYSYDWTLKYKREGYEYEGEEYEGGWIEGEEWEDQGQDIFKWDKDGNRIFSNTSTETTEIEYGDVDKAGLTAPFGAVTLELLYRAGVLGKGNNNLIASKKITN